MEAVLGAGFKVIKEKLCSLLDVNSGYLPSSAPQELFGVFLCTCENICRILHVKLLWCVCPSVRSYDD